MLGIDLDLVDPKTVQDCIIKACVKKRFETGHSGLRNYADCSGFVKSVQSALNLRPFEGDANSIFDEVGSAYRLGWCLERGRVPCKQLAPPQMHDFTIGVWKTPKAVGMSQSSPPTSRSSARRPNITQSPLGVSTVRWARFCRN